MVGATVNRPPLRVVFLLLAALAAIATAEEPWPGVVTKVVDGDTIQVQRSDETVKVRLSGIDCPESGQPFGRAARKAAVDLAFGKTVRIAPLATDRYGRTIAKVTLPDGRDLGTELVRSGLAWWYVRYAAHNEALQKAEAEAREKRVGLWADPAPIAPWDWRKTKGNKR